MKQIQTVFEVNGQTYAGAGAGQQTTSEALKAFPGKCVKLHGFVINGEFKPADLISHWERHKIQKQA